MASTSSSKKSEPRADDEEEKAKKWEKKQFPSHTRYIAFVVLAIVVVMSLAMGIIWAVVKPKRPKVVVQNGFIINGTRKISHADMILSGNLSFEINFSNPNKKATIYYDALNATSSFSDKTKNVQRLNGNLTQPPLGSIPIYFNFTAEYWSMYGYMPKYLTQGRIVVNIVFDAKIRFGFAKWKSQPRTIRIYCSPLVVFSGTTFKPTVCEVDY